MHTTCSDHIRPIDQAVLDLLRQHQGLNVQSLTELLDVTATAVRQRLDRLEEVGLIERRKESVGRGRPQFRYFLTELGMRYSSASYAALASALWQEVLDLPNPQMRSRLLRRVAKRMGQGLRESVSAVANLDERMAAMAAELGKRRVPVTVNSSGELPVLEMHVCPYPDLTGDKDERQLCELEQEMLSEAIGQAVQLDCCRLDGHNLCQFRPVPSPDVHEITEMDASSVEPPQRIPNT